MKYFTAERTDATTQRPGPGLENKQTDLELCSTLLLVQVFLSSLVSVEVKLLAKPLGFLEVVKTSRCRANSSAQVIGQRES